MKEVLGRLLGAFGVPFLIRRLFARDRITILIYHDPEPEALDRHLAWLAKRYRFISIGDLALALESGRWDRVPPHALVVTFDDGHRGNARLGPVFARHGVRPTIYLCSGIVGTHRPFWWKTEAARAAGPERLKRLPDAERRRRVPEAERDAPDRQALTWDESRALGALADLGAHTRSHPILPLCEDSAAFAEIVQSGQEVAAALLRPCPHFAYPNGNAGAREIAFARAAGYRTARSVEPGWNGPGCDPFRLKAMPVTDDASLAWLAVQAVGLPGLAAAALARLSTVARPRALVGLTGSRTGTNDGIRGTNLAE